MQISIVVLEVLKFKTMNHNKVTTEGVEIS
jgi:hypothetical protein